MVRVHVYKHAILKTSVHPITNMDGLRVVTSVSQALWELVVKIKDAMITSKTMYVIVMRARQSQTKTTTRTKTTKKSIVIETK